MDNNEFVNASQGTAEATAEPVNTETGMDAKYTIEALKEIIAENKNTMQQLQQELAETKKVNAKLLAKMDVSQPEKSAEDLIYDLFNRR